MFLLGIQNSSGIWFKHTVLIGRMFRAPHSRFDTILPFSALLRIALDSLKVLMCAKYASRILGARITMLISRDGGTRSSFISQLSKRSVGGRLGRGCGTNLGKVIVLKSFSRGGICPPRACERTPLQQSSPEPPDRVRQPASALGRPPAHPLA